MKNSLLLLRSIFSRLRLPIRKGSDEHKIRMISRRLGYVFRNEQLLIQALKHRSYLSVTNEARIQANERLELLGDAVLGLVVTEYLFKTYPEKEEGGLTLMKSMLVSRRSLAHVAKEFGLGKFLLLSDAEAKSGGRKRASILADAVEAIIGAVYLDGGLENANRIIDRNIFSRLDRLMTDGSIQNYKSLLLEHCQSLSLDGPRYVVENEEGPDHEKVFTIAGFVDGKRMGVGSGQTKKIAEQRAAEQVLLTLHIL
jgi:ribonuclease-3